MRIAKLELLAYGPFRGTTLDLSAPGLHVVVGRNEAGKSTTLRAIAGLLYGIDAKTPDAHVHKFADLRIGGVLEDGAGQRLRVIRRKGNVNTLLDERDRPIDEGVLERFVGGVSKETFTHAFGLDHVTLEAGAKALLEGKGDLGESLFDASVGGGGEVQRLLSELAAEADRIYKPRATSLPLNEALKAFAEAQKSLREKQSLPQAFVEQERGLEQALEERARLGASKKVLEARKARFARARRRVPLERRRERVRVERAALGAVVDQVARVERLQARFSAYERDLDRRRALFSEAERLEERLREAARRAGVEEGADMEAMRLDARKEARVRTLSTERAKLTERLEAGSVEIVRLEREVARFQELVDASQSTAGEDVRISGAVRALERALEKARTMGDVEARLSVERARIERRTKELETRAEVLGLFEGALEVFVALRLPAITTVERLEARAVDIERRVTRLGERAVELDSESALFARQLAALAGDFAPPDMTTLEAARSARDAAWTSLRSSSDGSDRRALEVEVDRRIREADTIADRMIREADRVTTLARLRSEAETNARQRETVALELERARSERATIDDELAALFAEANVRPRGFAEMRAWLERHASIVEAYAALEQARATLLDEETKVAVLRVELISALEAAASGTSALEAPDETTPLADLVAPAASRLAEIEARRRDAAAAERSLAEARVKLDDRVAARTRDERALAIVTEQLGELLSPLGISVDASAEEVSRSIEALRELFALSDKKAESRAQVRSVEADVSSFEADLARAIAELAPDLASMDPREAALVLFARGVSAKRCTQELLTISGQLEEDEGLELEDEERATAADPDASARVEEELREALEELDGEISRLTERIGSLRRGLETMRAESNAAEAAAAAELHLSRVRTHAERWSRAKLASVVLAREIERYREENQGPLLASSSSLFSRLTLGAFSGIRAGFDDKDRPCLRCVRADSAIEVDVAGLSTGTRDQLYLSLRLASLLRRADVTDPMPLVLDDVLIHFDDPRAAAALTVLAEVSRRMQVLFFTHHARLVELARASVPAEQLVVHELSRVTHAAEASAITTG